MTKTQYTTPGPWELVPKNDHHGFYVKWASGQSICDLYFVNPHGTTRHFENAEANAHLIAAAPDLLEALEVILEHYPYNEDEDDYNYALSKTIKAIAKARKGGSDD